jgi:hypothetical protein
VDDSTLKVEGAHSSEMSVLTRPKRRHVPEDGILRVMQKAEYHVNNNNNKIVKNYLVVMVFMKAYNAEMAE